MMIRNRRIMIMMMMVTIQWYGMCTNVGNLCFGSNNNVLSAPKYKLIEVVKYFCSLCTLTHTHSHRYKLLVATVNRWISAIITLIFIVLSSRIILSFYLYCAIKRFCKIYNISPANVP